MEIELSTPDHEIGRYSFS